MLLYRTDRDLVLVTDDGAFRLPVASLAELLSAPSLASRLRELLPESTSCTVPAEDRVRAPIDDQEVWAAGVTYFRSRDARMEESREAGGSDFYDRVYVAERPELFFKATARRVAGPGHAIRVRDDSAWNVPEPELTLVVSSPGTIVGYTIGNDVSSRSIEGENPLYLPQAKVYRGACALGPAILVRDEPLPATTAIRIAVTRHGEIAFSGATTLESLKRRPDELVEYLMREDDHPSGVLLMTGTGIVPDRDFTLMPGDDVEITIEGIGALRNRVAPIAAPDDRTER